MENTQAECVTGRLQKVTVTNIPDKPGKTPQAVQIQSVEVSLFTLVTVIGLQVIALHQGRFRLDMRKHLFLERLERH